MHPAKRIEGNTTAYTLAYLAFKKAGRPGPQIQEQLPITPVQRNNALLPRLMTRRSALQRMVVSAAETAGNSPQAQAITVLTDAGEAVSTRPVRTSRRDAIRAMLGLPVLAAAVAACSSQEQTTQVGPKDYSENMADFYNMDSEMYTTAYQLSKTRVSKIKVIYGQGEFLNGQEFTTAQRWEGTDRSVEFQGQPVWYYDVYQEIDTFLNVTDQGKKINIGVTATSSDAKFTTRVVWAEETYIENGVEKKSKRYIPLLVKTDGVSLLNAHL